MQSPAFTASAPLSKAPLSIANAITSTSALRRTPQPSTPSSSSSSSSTVRASVADVYQWRSQTKEAKAAATSTGVYTVQCTEGTAGANTADSKRLYALSAQFRLRQSSLSTRYRDLYATRRAAIALAAGSHTAEQYAVKFPARASATVSGSAEASLACSRYMPETQGSAQHYMQKCVTNQYKAMNIPYGEYSTLCSDGVTKDNAETSRISALAVEFKAGQLSKSQITQARYNAIARATTLGFGCEYEESYFQQFPSMAAAMTQGINGSYAGGVVGTLFETGGNKSLSVAEQLERGVNVESYWPSFLMRAAVEKPKSNVKFWTISKSPIKNYAYMSSAAVQWGTKGQGEKPVVKNYDTWSTGWQPQSSLSLPSA